jgi:hypothetical protein
MIFLLVQERWKLAFTVPSTIYGLEGKLDVVERQLVVVSRVAMSQDE